LATLVINLVSRSVKISTKGP